MLKILVDLLSFNDTVGVLATLAYSHVLLNTFFFDVEPHVSEVVLVHVEDVFCKQTAFTPTSCLHDF